MAANPDPTSIFHEEQRFRQPWLWALLIFEGAIMARALLRLSSHPRELIPVLIGAGIVAAVAWLVVTARMVTDVNESGVRISGRLALRMERRISFAQIESCQARKYNPILEYGGWGLRRGPSGTAYNVSGNQGAQLELTSGQRLLIGSQRAEELAEAIGGGMAGTA